MPARKAPNGKRRPIHVGTRLIAGKVSVAIVAVPLLRGEYVERVALDVYNVTTTAETNVDQPPIFETVGLFLPFQWSSQSLSTGILDAAVRDHLGDADNVPIGGEPNPSGDLGSLGTSRTGRARQVFRRTVIGDPMPVGLDGLDNADARFIDRFRSVVKRGWEVDSDGILIFGGRMASVAAQTDFGVSEIDLSATLKDFMRGYTDPYGADAELGVSAKAAELFYGGDNYIEADSFKETSRRQYIVARPTIHRTTRLSSFM